MFEGAQINILLIEYSENIQILEYHFGYSTIRFKGDIINTYSYIHHSVYYPSFSVLSIIQCAIHHSVCYPSFSVHGTKKDLDLI